MRWVIGDIHGMLRPLDALLGAIDRADADARLLFTGDYVNRGPDARGVIDRLLALPPGKARFIRGNHDDVFDEVLHGHPYAPNAAMGNRLVAFGWFMKYGLDATLQSYGVDAAQLEHLATHPSLPALERLAEAVPATHRQFLRSLGAVIEEEDLFVGHGMWGVDESDDFTALAADAGLRSRLVWRRFEPEEIDATKAWRRTGYFGHTPVSQYGVLARNERDAGPLPIRAHRVVLVDTGCAVQPDGRLTAFCHDEGRFIQADREGKVMEARADSR